MKSVGEEKGEFRKKIKKLLKDLAVNQNLWSDINLQLSLKALDLAHHLSQRISPFILGAYAPLSDEAQWDKALGDKGKLNYKIAYPLIVEGEMLMSFALCEAHQLQIKNVSKGISLAMPDEKRPKVIPSALFVPAMAFDYQGNRLGRGKGYYDRYLANYQGLKIGICLEEQLVSQLPCFDHDIAMDAIITSKQFIKINKSLDIF